MVECLEKALDDTDVRLLDNRQVHAVPTDPEALAALARRINGKDQDADALRESIEKTMRRVRAAYNELLH